MSLPEKKPLMLHCCCGPCSTACIERLLGEGRSCRLFFSNSNIDTREEFERRLENLRTVARHYHLEEPIVDPYRHDLWLEHVSRLPGYDAAPEGGARCARCFQWSLQRTAAMAHQLGMPFCTSLTVSPHKSSKMLFAIGKALPEFQEYDFKKRDGFLCSIRIAKQLGLYRQNYCGCEFSKQEAQERRQRDAADPQKMS